MRDALSAASDMIQPGILLIGKEYFIKIENLHMKIDNCNLEKALAYLIAFYYVLCIEYPIPLKFVFVLLESLFDLPLSVKSSKVTYLRSHLAGIQ